MVAQFQPVKWLSALFESASDRTPEMCIQVHDLHVCVGLRRILSVHVRACPCLYAYIQTESRAEVPPSLPSLHNLSPPTRSISARGHSRSLAGNERSLTKGRQRRVDLLGLFEGFAHTVAPTLHSI